jgi:hypothetical protein
MRVQDDGDRRILLARWVKAAFDPSGGSGENDLGHGFGPRSRLLRSLGYGVLDGTRMSP